MQKYWKIFSGNCIRWCYNKNSYFVQKFWNANATHQWFNLRCYLNSPQGIFMLPNKICKDCNRRKTYASH
jgi:hypothetical protein